jgi:hypothetical protein
VVSLHSLVATASCPVCLCLEFGLWGNDIQYSLALHRNGHGTAGPYVEIMATCLSVSLFLLQLKWKTCRFDFVLGTFLKLEPETRAVFRWQFFLQNTTVAFSLLFDN